MFSGFASFNSKVARRKEPRSVVAALAPHPIPDVCTEMAAKQVPIVQRTVVRIKPIEELVDELDEKYHISGPELRRHLAAEAAMLDLERIKTRGLADLRSLLVH
ncbi:MAG: hypothetical protein ACFE8Z_07310 [Candidatus Hermodarchaeota archaeon]